MPKGPINSSMWKMFAAIGFVLMCAYLIDSVGVAQHSRMKPPECFGKNMFLLERCH